MRTYIIQKDDTLQRIAARVYGDWTLYYLIYDSNRDTLSSLDVTKIYGTTIGIPDPAYEDSEHFIIEGDSYESLSLQYYGSEHYSGRIYDSNNGICIYEYIGKSIIIPKLIDKKRYKLALNNFNKNE